MNKVIFEAKIKRKDVNIEDSGQVVIVEPQWVVKGGDDNIFIRIQSWDESAEMEHKTINKLIGKKIRVTIEEIE